MLGRGQRKWGAFLCGLIARNIEAGRVQGRVTLSPDGLNGFFGGVLGTL
jgi:hypothetical protein